MDREYLFIDGGYLRKVLEGFGRKLGIPAIKPSLSAWKGSHDKAFYYDAAPPRRSDEEDGSFAERKQVAEEEFDAMRQISDFHVYTGKTLGTGRKVRQKQVDILIAVHMLMHSNRKNMSRATLLAGDGDFVPLVEELVRDGMVVTVWYEESSASEDLLLAADRRKQIHPIQALASADHEYRELYPRPNFQHHQKKNPEQVAFRMGTAPGVGRVELCHWRDGFVIVSQSTGGGFESCSHPDETLVTKFFEVQHDAQVSWDPGPSSR